MATTERYTQTPEIQANIEHDVIVNADPDRVRQETYYANVDSDKLAGEQPIHIGVAEPLSGKSKSVMLMPVAWSDYSKRSFQAGRLDVMAQLSDSRLVGIDFPGMGDTENGRGDELSEKNLEEAKQGRMHELAMTYWDVLANQSGVLVDEDGERPPVVLWLNSLSTLTGAELINTAPEGVKISDAYFSESMALRERSTTSLGLDFMTKGGKYLSEYLAMNKGFDVAAGTGLSGLAKQVKRQRRSHQAAMQALAGGKQIEILAEALKDDGRGVITPDTTIHIVRASKGLVSEKDHQRFVEEMKRHGAQVRVQEIAGEAHGIQDSMPALVGLLQDLSINRR